MPMQELKFLCGSSTNYKRNLTIIEILISQLVKLSFSYFRYSQICRTILESKKLQDFFGLILAAGNFINCVSGLIQTSHKIGCKIAQYSQKNTGLQTIMLL